MARLFGTDGVRGVVNDTLTPELAFHLGRAAAVFFVQGDDTAARPRFLIGFDTRISGTMLAAALAAGVCSAGGDVDIVGVIPTPGVAYLTRTGDYTAGVVISASHNPYPDNGIKFFDRFGFKLPDAAEDEIEAMLRADALDNSARPTADAVGRIQLIPEAAQRYTDYIAATAPCRLDGLKIVVDAAHGAASDVTPAVLRELGAEVITIASEPNGTNINAGVGSTHPERLRERVLAEGANAGVANDGDSDRCLLIDETGAVLDGDHILLLAAQQLKSQNKLKNDTVVATVMSNIGFKKALEKMGLQAVFTSVGDRYVLEEMRARGYVLGGEQSGHVIFLDYNTTGDGVLTAVQTLAIMKQSGRKLSELAQLMTTYPQILRNVRVYDKESWRENPFIMAAIGAAEEELGENGRVLVRASGTEPLLRVMAEGPDHDQLERIVTDICATVQREIGVEE